MLKYEHNAFQSNFFCHSQAHSQESYCKKLNSLDFLIDRLLVQLEGSVFILLPSAMVVFKAIHL